MTEALKYEALLETLQEQGYTRSGRHAAQWNGKFMQIIPEDLDVKAVEDCGWKLHISTAGADAPRAWDALLGQLMDQGVAAKVVSPELAERFSNPSDGQRGKMITVYFDNNRNRDLEEFCKDIERTLRDNGIEPGFDVENDRKLDGSAYINYRNDRSLDGQYISAGVSGGHNPGGHEDPFLSISVEDLERTPYEKLNITTGTIYNNFGVDQSWVKDGGDGTGKAESARLAVDHENQAHYLAEKLESQGIEAFAATKGDQNLVIVQDTAFDSISEEAVKTVDQTIQAEGMRHRFKQSKDPYFSQIDWQPHEATEATGAPHLRAYVRDEEYAAALADYATDKTGHTVRAASKGEQHLVIMDMKEPAPSPQHLQREQQKKFSIDMDSNAIGRSNNLMGFEPDR